MVVSGGGVSLGVKIARYLPTYRRYAAVVSPRWFAISTRDPSTRAAREGLQGYVI